VTLGGFIGALTFGASRYLSRSHATTSQHSPITCHGAHAAHTVIIQGNKLSPVTIQAHLCDQLTITNNDDRLREMAFGQHEHHTPYNGVTEKVLNQGGSLTVTLDQTGSYTFHDHLQDEVAGSFTVTP